MLARQELIIFSKEMFDLFYLGGSLNFNYLHGVFSTYLSHRFEQPKD
jgi:hypothetical protein